MSVCAGEMGPIAAQVWAVIGTMGVFDKVEREELFGVGLLGYTKALAGFKPEKQCKLSTYAAQRIRGEILDYLRSCDFCSRHTRRRIKAGAAEDPGYHAVQLTSACARTSDDGERANRRVDIERALETLSAREIRVLRECFWDDRSVAQIANEIGLSPGRISQVKTGALTKLETLLRGAIAA